MSLKAVPQTLDDWLAYQQTLHPRSIELGLDRVRVVAQRLRLGRVAQRVITVAGTNGKGSSVAILRSIYRAAGRRVGCFTSPHLRDYRERIELPEGLVEAAQLLAVFAQIEAARGDTSLSFFEYGTLAALLCFAQADLDVAILEVGLGGRLDAVNLVDADAVLITTIGLDHQEWLGPDRDAIGREKAGVLRAAQFAVYADQPAVDSVLAVAQAVGCVLQRPGLDYRYWREEDAWYLTHKGATQPLRVDWPAGLHAPVQIHNLAACAALVLAQEPDFDPAALRHGLRGVHVAGRLQPLCVEPEVWLDVAHNPQAALSLLQWLQQQPRRPTVVLLGMLADKDVATVVQVLQPLVGKWLLVGLDTLSPRGLSAVDLAARLPALNVEVCAGDVPSALAHALKQALTEQSRLLICGSFVLAEQALGWSGWPSPQARVSFADERQ
jgi:dihydrofolate synthase/folylpolyglutamate synthase